MDQIYRVTVDPGNTNASGESHQALQAAVDDVASRGGGEVRVAPGRYVLGNAVHLRHGVRLVGAGEETIWVKNPSRTTELIDDTDWYDRHVTVANPEAFEVGGGILLRGRDVSGGATSVTKHTVVGIDGNVVQIDSQPRKNFWTTHDATAATLFPMITANWTNDIAIQDLVLDGNRERNELLDGNYGGCIFLQDCNRVRISGVVARNYHGDGISWQICNDVTVENCVSADNADLGLHPGSGSQRPVIRGNRVTGCRIGLFWCWGVRHGLAEENEIRSSRDYGISIGHRDTDNVMRRNRVYDSGVAGLHFRDDQPAQRAAHRNVVEGNLFENAGSADAPGVGIDVAGAVDEVSLAGNRIVNSADGFMASGIRIADGVSRLTMTDNVFVGLDSEVHDQRLPTDDG